MRTLSLLPALAAGLLLGGCTPSPEDEAPAPTRIRIATATEGPYAPVIRANGLLANKDEIRLSFKVTGVVKRIAVREGERVRRGQLLAEIEPAEVNAQVEQARQAHAKAQRDLERGERLHADQVISLEQLQDLRTQMAVSDAELSSAQFNASYAAIVASQDGTVLHRLAEERELVAAGTPVLVLGAQNDGFVVRVGLADREIVQVKLGDVARIQLDALPGEVLQGTLTEVASAADSASGMFDVDVAIAPIDSQPLKSGLVAKVSIEPASAQLGKRIYVPMASIVEGNGLEARVFVLDGQYARRRDVQVAFIDGEHIALIGGVAAGEQIITDGAQYLADGELVTIAEPAAAAQLR